MPNRQIFQEPSEEHEGDSTVAWLEGIGRGVYTLWDFAQAFKVAGDVLVEQVLSGEFEAYQMIYPVLYNYRHCLELYLKFFVGKPEERTHNLAVLLERFQKYIKDDHGIEVPKVYRTFVLEFHDFDQNSDVFRYPEQLRPRSTKETGEFAIDLATLRKKMDAFEEAFARVIDADPELRERQSDLMWWGVQRKYE